MPETSLTKTVAGGTQASKTKLAPKARELLTERTNGLPVWIRAPKSGVEFYTGFSRAKLYQLAGEGKIRSVSIREQGAVKGTRLFNLQSILDFIVKCEAETAEAAETPDTDTMLQAAGAVVSSKKEADEWR